MNVNEDAHKHTDVENSIFGHFPVENVLIFADIKLIFKMK